MTQSVNKADRNLRVLVIDDNHVTNNVLSMIVRKYIRCEVVSYTDPQKALRHAANELFDLVFVDYYLPNINGQDVIEKVKAVAGYDATPIVVVTACESPDVSEQLIDAGATMVVLKPIRPLFIKSTVQALVTRNFLRETAPQAG